MNEDEPHHKQKRIGRGGYLDPDQKPSPEDIERRTRCSCERPNPVRESLGVNWFGEETFVRRCIKCGRMM